MSKQRYKAKSGTLQPVIEKGEDGLFYSSIWSANSEQVWRTGDGYKNLSDAEHAIKLLDSPKMQYPIIYAE